VGFIPLCGSHLRFWLWSSILSEDSLESILQKKSYQLVPQISSAHHENEVHVWNQIKWAANSNFFCDIRSLDLCWMQNLILHRIVRVLSRSPRDNMGFRVKILCFSPVLLVCLAKIFSSTYVHHLITFFESRIKFCIEWSEFQTDHLGKILWVWVKILCSSPSSAGISSRNFLFRPVFTIWLVFVGCRIKYCTEWPQFPRDCNAKIWSFGQNTVFLALFY